MLVCKREREWVTVRPIAPAYWIIRCVCVATLQRPLFARCFAGETLGRDVSKLTGTKQDGWIGFLFRLKQQRRWGVSQGKVLAPLMNITTTSLAYYFSKYTFTHFGTPLKQPPRNKPPQKLHWAAFVFLKNGRISHSLKLVKVYGKNLCETEWRHFCNCLINRRRSFEIVLCSWKKWSSIKRVYWATY